jgi:uncharacterized protein YkwD
MDENNNSIEETLTQDTEAEIEIDLDDNQDDETVDWKAIALKNEKAYKDQKTRAEIAEGKAKATKPVTQSNSTPALTVKDGFALAKADVNDDDVEDVLEYATFKKISVAEALKSNVVKTMLAEKNEFRQSQNASTGSTVKRATPKITDDSILENARKGNLKEDENEIRALFRARMGIK